MIYLGWYLECLEHTVSALSWSYGIKIHTVSRHIYFKYDGFKIDRKIFRFKGDSDYEDRSRTISVNTNCTSVTARAWIKAFKNRTFIFAKHLIPRRRNPRSCGVLESFEKSMKGLDIWDGNFFKYFSKIWTKVITEEFREVFFSSSNL